MKRNQPSGPAWIALCICVVALLSACSSVPVYNAKNVVVMTKASISENEIADAIRSACHQRGWIVEKVGEWKIKATTHIRSHTASVMIHYTKSTFDITYYDSNNLDYNGHSIHKNYNIWIQQLAEIIKSEIEFRYPELRNSQ